MHFSARHWGSRVRLCACSTTRPDGKAGQTEELARDPFFEMLVARYMRHRLAAFLEDEILARSSTLAPKAIANLSGLLYGSGVRCEKNRAVMQLRQSAMQKLQAFSASELVDLASGLANSRVMDESCLQTLRKRMDAAASKGDSDAGCSRQLAAPAAPACERDWPLPCPGILADLETAVVLSKPPGWSCATSISGKSLLAEGRKRPPTISHFLQRLGWERPVSQDPSVDHGLVHRLDLETSGALLAAKTFHSYWRLRLDFSAQDVRKRYLALVHGFLPRQWQRLDMPLQLQRIPHSDSLRSVRSKSVVNHDFGRSSTRTPCLLMDSRRAWLALVCVQVGRNWNSSNCSSAWQRPGLLRLPKKKPPQAVV